MNRIAFAIITKIRKNKILIFAAIKSNFVHCVLWDLPNDLFSCPELKYITSQKHSSSQYKPSDTWDDHIDD